MRWLERMSKKPFKTFLSHIFLFNVKSIIVSSSTVWRRRAVPDRRTVDYLRTFLPIYIQPPTLTLYNPLQKFRSGSFRVDDVDLMELQNLGLFHVVLCVVCALKSNKNVIVWTFTERRLS